MKHERRAAPEIGQVASIYQSGDVLCSSIFVTSRHCSHGAEIPIQSLFAPLSTSLCNVASIVVVDVPQRANLNSHSRSIRVVESFYRKLQFVFLKL
jgi:hypothetical protein